MSQFRPTGFNILPTVVKNLLIINGLVFLASNVLGEVLGIDLTEKFGLYFFQSEFFKPHQLATHLFMHGNFMHLFSNMFALWMFGAVLENVWGPKRFLIYYIVTGLGAALLHSVVTAYDVFKLQNEINAIISSNNQEGFNQLIQNYNSLAHYCIGKVGDSPNKIMECIIAEYKNIPTVGASGAVFGVLLAFGMLFPNTYIFVGFFFPLKAKYFVMLYALFELWSGFKNSSTDNVAHFAHLGGMIFGYFLIRHWNKTRRRDFF